MIEHLDEFEDRVNRADRPFEGSARRRHRWFYLLAGSLVGFLFGTSLSLLATAVAPQGAHEFAVGSLTFQSIGALAGFFLGLLATS